MAGFFFFNLTTLNRPSVHLWWLVQKNEGVFSVAKNKKA